MNSHEVGGKNSHDARLIAAMQVHEINHLMTYNIQDFQRFTEVCVIHPDDAASLPPLD